MKCKLGSKLQKLMITKYKILAHCENLCRYNLYPLTTTFQQGHHFLSAITLITICDSSKSTDVRIQINGLVSWFLQEKRECD